jgi:hypothetical protein
MTETGFTTKLRCNLPWMVRYPADRLKALMERTAFEKKHVILTIANHFEPGWSPTRILDHKTQIERLRRYVMKARAIGNAVRDADGTSFRHTNFYPAEQYHPDILNILAEMQSDGLGETEVHLHHGVEKPDTADHLRKVLTEFRDTLVEKHKLLSYDARGNRRYAFVHGNLALANSCAGRFCGVDNEMRVLHETGCYADLTLPSAPDQSQVPTINAIYTPGGDIDRPVPHRYGERVSVNGNLTQLPLIVTGPLVLNWTSRRAGLPLPRIDDGALAANQPLDVARFRRWLSANITVAGRSDWVFVKLYCHGFFDADQSVCIGDEAAAFFARLVELGEKTSAFQLHFASAREAFNIIRAAMDGRSGSPNDYRDYELKTVMSEKKSALHATR